MRLALISAVAVILTFAGPAFSSAAQNDHLKASNRYTGCFCHFGYGGNTCIPDVSCGSEGGRCGGSCALAPDRDYSARG